MDNSPQLFGRMWLGYNREEKFLAFECISDGVGCPRDNGPTLSTGAIGGLALTCFVLLVIAGWACARRTRRHMVHVRGVGPALHADLVRANKAASRPTRSPPLSLTPPLGPMASHSAPAPVGAEWEVWPPTGKQRLPPPGQGGLSPLSVNKSIPQIAAVPEPYA